MLARTLIWFTWSMSSSIFKLNQWAGIGRVGGRGRCGAERRLETQIETELARRECKDH